MWILLTIVVGRHLWLMFLSDSSGSGQGFHAQIASLSKDPKNQSAHRKHRKSSSSNKKHPKYTGFTRVSKKPIKEANTTTTANGKKPSHRPTSTTVPHKDISKPMDRENSVLNIDYKNSIMDNNSNATATKSNHRLPSRTSSEDEETLNIGHLKISMEIIDFNNNNTSDPSNNSTDLSTWGPASWRKL